MTLEQELAHISPDRDTVLTVGVFDGVHRGHQHLIRQLVRQARESGRLAGVVTFRNHPASVLRSDFKPRYLTTIEERKGLIRALGVDFVIPISFDPALSRLPAREFVALLQRRLRMRGLVVGPDFAMGHRREGDSKALAAMGEEMGFTVTVVNLLVDDGHAVKSTTIRNALARGEVDIVAQMLGRPFAVTGMVVTGKKRGRQLGYPTANLTLPPDMAVPANGIYAAWATLRQAQGKVRADHSRLKVHDEIGDRCYMAAVNIGTRPTFETDGERMVEAFLLDFHGDIYGQGMRLEFVQRLRDEVKFDSVDALLRQMDQDVKQTRAILQARRPVVS